MKKYFLILTLISILPCSHIHAQKKKKKDAPTIEEIMDSMAVYNFEAAIEMLEEDIALKTKRKKPTEEQENLLTLAHRNLGKLMATERITIIDSIIVDKQNVLSHIHLSNESGNLQTMRQLLNKPDTMDCMMFRNQLDNQAIFAQQDANGKLTLYKSELIGKEWTKPTPLKGIADEDTEASYNYPFMLTDGATLYYAATDEEGLGGYDIYMTRYDAEEQEFLAPENIGMPFNSTANDYLMVVDEVSNLGWFATDRNQPDDKVCIYVFVPNTGKNRVNVDEMGYERALSIANLSSIADTQTDEELVSNARRQMTMLIYAQEAARNNGDFLFVIDEFSDYRSLDDFKNNEARELFKEWQAGVKAHENDIRTLNKYRDAYASASDEKRESMRETILNLESKIESDDRALELKEYAVRRLELGKK